MKNKLIFVAGIGALLSIPVAEAAARGLRGSAASMEEQHAVAVEQDLTFIDDAAEVRKLVDAGGLETIEPDADYAMSGVSYPYAVPEVRLLIQRLAKQYRAANGTQLVVTSLMRPGSQQPRNAHELSVHPAGMAVDFRVPQDAKSRQWLESVLLQLENAGVLDVTRERFPPHYHVAVFPAAYARYVERTAPPEESALAEAPAPVIAAAPPSDIGIPLVPSNQRLANDLLLIVAALGGITFAALLARQRIIVRA